MSRFTDSRPLVTCPVLRIPVLVRGPLSRHEGERSCTVALPGDHSRGPCDTRHDLGGVGHGMQLAARGLTAGWATVLASATTSTETRIVSQGSLCRNRSHGLVDLENLCRLRK
jgi:hypothetical protein